MIRKKKGVDENELEPWEKDVTETFVPPDKTQPVKRGRPSTKAPKLDDIVSEKETEWAMDSIYGLIRSAFASTYEPSDKEKDVDSTRLQRLSLLSPYIRQAIRLVSAFSWIFGMLERVQKFRALSQRKPKEKGQEVVNEQTITPEVGEQRGNTGGPGDWQNILGRKIG